jgi:glycosyltransferase involved in cell wall biosynthesis
MRLVKLPTISNKYLDTIVHSFLSSIHALSQGYDVALYFIAGNSPVTWIPRLAGTKTILNVDGLDWRRQKWPWLAKVYLQFSEYLATFLPDKYLTDSVHVQQSYKDRFGDEPIYIPYGSDIAILSSEEILKQYDLQSRKYILFVGRLVPENCAHHLVEAFCGLDTDMKCVIVGDAPYAEKYQVALKELAGEDDRIVFTGYIFGRGYQEFGSHAYLFVESSGVGGTHPALIEAMAMGNCVIVNNTPENLETIGNAGCSYDGDRGALALRPLLEQLLKSPEIVEAYRRKGRERAESVYSWEAVTDSYEQLFHEVCGIPASSPSTEP